MKNLHFNTSKIGDQFLRNDQLHTIISHSFEKEDQQNPYVECRYKTVINHHTGEVYDLYYHETYNCWEFSWQQTSQSKT